MFEFYLAVLTHMSGKDKGSAPFLKVIDKADDKERRNLEDAAHYISRHADGPLKSALREFDFTGLDFPFSFFDFLQPRESSNEVNNSSGNKKSNPVDSLFDMIDSLPEGVKEKLMDEFLTDMLDDDIDDDIWEDIAEIEDMVDELGIRGASDSEIQEIRGRIMSSPTEKRELQQQASFLKPYVEELSHEALVLLYGRKNARYL